MSRRILVAAVAGGVMAAALVSYIGIPRRQPAQHHSLPPEVIQEIEQQWRLERRKMKPPIIDTHPLQNLRGSPFPPDY